MLKSLKYLFLVLLVGLGNCLIAQQLPIFTQYSEYGGLINPSYIHFDNYHLDYDVSAGVSYRDQWSQIPDRPRTFIARYEKSNTKQSGANINFGGYLMNDKIGAFSTTELRTRVAVFFRTKDVRKQRLGGFSLGLNVGISQYTVDLRDLPSIDIDPLLFNGRSAVFTPDLGVGLSYINEFANSDYLQIGLSVPQVFSLDPTFRNESQRFEIQKVPHFYVTGSYYKMLKDEKYLEFSTWIKHVDNIPLNVDALVRYRFNKYLWLGAGANSAGIIHTEVGLLYTTESKEIFKLSYSFNPSFQTHTALLGNIHELNITYLLKSRKR